MLLLPFLDASLRSFSIVASDFTDRFGKNLTIQPLLDRQFTDLIRLAYSITSLSVFKLIVFDYSFVVKMPVAVSLDYGFGCLKFCRILNVSFVAISGIRRLRIFVHRAGSTIA
jgi:hypothetical protein